jgi:DNA-binding winged helix-turn-helix (wHTH) protein
MVRGRACESEGKYEEAWSHIVKADRIFLGGHHWYYHLHSLDFFARLSRLRGRFEEARWYLDLLEEATRSSSFGRLREHVDRERKLLDEASVDFLLDAQSGIVRTRDAGSIKVGKQFVLMGMLESLCKAHLNGSEVGVTKAELIQAVWNENYHPSIHDNKLYYNINRLRRLIEPDVAKPKYLLNSKDGYRLAPGLNVRWIKNLKKISLNQSMGDELQ